MSCQQQTGLALLLCALTSTARADDWPSWGFGPLRQRHSAERTGLAFAPDWSLTIAVGAAGQRALTASPAVADGYLVFGGLDRRLHAVRATDGKELWQFEVGGDLYSAPTVQEGRVYVTSTEGEVVALRLDNGAPLWRQPVGGVTYGSPTLVSDSRGAGLLVAPGFPVEGVARLDAQTGKVVWNTARGALAKASQSTVAVAEDVAIVGVIGGLYYGLDLGTGLLRWRYDTADDLYLSAPAVRKGTAFLLVGGSEPKLHAVAAAGGTPVTGWPITLAPIGADGAGKRLARLVAKSSLAIADDLVLAQIRFTDFVDRNNDGVPDQYHLREQVFAVSATDGAVRWAVSLDDVFGTDPVIIPTLTSCPTPAVFTSLGGYPLVAAASTLGRALRVFDGRDGTPVWQGLTASGTRSSPTFANGRLFLGTDAGALHAFASTTNRPPLPPVAHRPFAYLPSDKPLLTWLTPPDSDGTMPKVILRLDRDGEILHDWEQELHLEPGTSQALLPPLPVDTTFVFALRAQDQEGALSDWSPLYTIRTMVPPAVTIGGRPVAGLAEALSQALPGQVVSLGPGTFLLQDTVAIPSGVTLRGAGPFLTVLQGGGLPAAVSLAGGDAATPTRVEGVTVAGAKVGIDAVLGRGELRHVIIRDNDVAGVRIAAAAEVSVVNATLARNKTALEATGRAVIKNSLVFGGDTGLTAHAPGKIASRYNDLFDNRIAFENVEPDASDLAVAVLFTDGNDTDYHLQPNQPTTDQGDPADPFEAEPAPHGGAINLGAYGGTGEAEISRTSTGSDGDSEPGTSGFEGGLDHNEAGIPFLPGVPRATSPPGPDASGCACELSGPRGRPPGQGGALPMIVLIILLIFRPSRRDLHERSIAHKVAGCSNRGMPYMTIGRCSAHPSRVASLSRDHAMPISILGSALVGCESARIHAGSRLRRKPRPATGRT